MITMFLTRKNPDEDSLEALETNDRVTDTFKLIGGTPVDAFQENTSDSLSC